MLSGERSEALERSKGLPPSAANIERVGRAVEPEAARWAFTQWALREKARAKFSLAEEMLFTREALEQATHESLSGFHASLFPAGELVADLTAGIGADLIALALRGPAVGYEIDAERAAYARHNLSVHGLEAEVRAVDCLAEVWSFSFAFADPARRVEGRRTLRLDEFQPDPRELSRRMAPLEIGVMKLSPMLPDSSLEELGTRVSFVSLSGECREALIGIGKQVVGGRFAILAESGATLEIKEPQKRLPPLGEPLTYLFEADPAAIRAHGLPNLCDEFGLCELGDSNGYLTGEHPVSSPWLKSYRVLNQGKLDLADAKRTLRDLGSGTPVVKSRAGIDPIKLQRELKSQGERETVVIVYPVGKSLRYVIGEPIPKGQ